MSSKQVRTVSTRRSRSTARLNQHLEKNLLAYAAAASAGLLSSALPSEAQIIYTPSNIVITTVKTNHGPTYTTLDLNNDGKADFGFVMSATAKYSSYGYSTRAKFLLKVVPAQPGNNAVQGKLAATASAMPAGAMIGPKQKFGNGDLYMQHNTFNGTAFKTSGSWRTVEFAYVGLKFVIGGQVHYGWARVKLPTLGNITYPSIYGYAYESTPNKGIAAGRMSASASDSTTAAAPASLGALASGVLSRGTWREKNNAPDGEPNLR
jgi:hypothetical protein